MGKGTLTHNPPGKPLPDNHPFKRGLIVFGAKRPVSYGKRLPDGSPEKPAGNPQPEKTEAK